MEVEGKGDVVGVREMEIEEEGEGDREREASKPGLVPSLCLVRVRGRGRCRGRGKGGGGAREVDSKSGCPRYNWGVSELWGGRGGGEKGVLSARVQVFYVYDIADISESV